MWPANIGNSRPGPGVLEAVGHEKGQMALADRPSREEPVRLQWSQTRERRRN